MNEGSSDNKKVNRIGEFSIVEIFHFLTSRARYIVKITSFFTFLGIIYALTAKIEFEAGCKLMLDKQNENAIPLSGFSGLAGLVGVDLQNSQPGLITPEIYPEILMSYPFLIDVLDKPIRFSKLDTLVSTYIYLTEIDNPSIWQWVYFKVRNLADKSKTLFSSKGKIKKDAVQDKLIYLSKEKLRLYNRFKDRLEFDVNNSSGMITIKTRLSDPLGAAYLTDVVVTELTEYIIKYKIQKSEENLLFIQERFEETKEQFELAQEKLAIFNDRNKNVITALAKVEQQKLQDDYNISYEVYKNLATQLEQAKIKVKEDTPIFTIIDPIIIPNEKIEPQRKLIVIISVLLGLLISSSIITFRFLYSS